MIGWIVLLTNQKALVFEVRVVGFVYVKGTCKEFNLIFGIFIEAILHENCICLVSICYIETKVLKYP